MSIPLSPVELAAQVYQKEPCAATFREDLEAHLLHGYVFSTPEAFVMGRPVISTAPANDIVNPWHVFPVAECDAWLIYLAAGQVSTLLHLFPFPLPLICWQKRNRLRFHGVESALAKLEKIPHSARHGDRA